MEPWHFWIIGGIVLVILEMFTVGFVLASFGAACLVAAVVAGLGMGLNAQLTAFAIGSVISLLAVRPFFRRGLFGVSDPRPSGAAAMIGQPGVVVDRVGDDSAPGRVRIGGEEWRAVTEPDSLPLDPGSPVRVVAIDSATVTVTTRA